MLLDDRRECAGASNDVNEAVDWREADRKLRRIAARRGALDAEEAHWLVVARRAEVHVQLGYGSFLEYMERVLGYAPRTALERIRVAETLPTLPETEDALARGKVSYSAVRAITRVAKPENEREWLDAAAGKTIRELEVLFAGRKRGDRPGDPQDPALEPRALRLDLAPDVYAMFLETRRQLQDETGERLSDSDLVRLLCERAISRDGAAATTGPRTQISLTTCDTCKRGWQDGGGQTIEVTATAIAEAECDAVCLGHVDAEPPARVEQAVPPSVRRAVEARDHHRCSVPGCRAATHLHIHHLIPRARGGKNTVSNLILLCSAHHRAHHEGRLAIAGQPGSLRFTHADGRPYGAPADDLFTDAVSGLKGLGYSAVEAKRAVERARVHVDAAATLQDVITASLRECGKR